MEDKIKEQGLWAVTAPPPPPLHELQEDITCDIAIIGGGYTGVSAALHLAEAGIKAVLLESKYLGYGGSGRNVGLVNAGLWVLPEDVVKELGTYYGEQLNAVLGESPDLVFNLIEKYKMSCEAIRNGTLQCAHSKAGFRYLREREKQWGLRGAPVKLLDRHSAAEKNRLKCLSWSSMGLKGGDSAASSISSWSCPCCC